MVGFNAVTEMFRHSPEQILEIHVEHQKRADFEVEFAEPLSRIGVAVLSQKRETLDKLAGPGVKHQGIVLKAKAYPYLELNDILDANTIIALDEITDPHNFGAIIRSAVAFGAPHLLIMKDRAAEVTPTVSKSSAGALAYANIARITNLSRSLDELKEEGFVVIGLAGEGDCELQGNQIIQRGRPLNLAEKKVFVIGSEGYGLRPLVRKHCDFLVNIPMAPDVVSSLNASVAAGIVLYSLLSPGFACKMT